VGRQGARRAARRASGGQGPAPARRSAGSLSLERPVEVVGIGCSTGGPNALAEVVPALPRDWSVPTLIVQHMPAEFTARLAERLAARSGLDVREAVAGSALSGAQVWVAPGDQHL